LSILILYKNITGAEVNVDYVDLSLLNKHYEKKHTDSLRRVIAHGQFINGPEVDALEDYFSKYVGANYAVAVSSGTSALYLALKSLGIGSGDEVITVSNSYLATVSSVFLTGARPVLVDVGSDLNMNPLLIQEKITNKTKAILPVHLTGKPANMTEINKVAKSNNIYVVEDAAQAIGARYKEGSAGNLGDIGCFSFHPLKNLSALGDGGIVTTNSEELYSWIKKARNHGHIGRDDSEFWSHNMRLDTLQASFLLNKVDDIEDMTEKRVGNAVLYRKLLGNNLNISLPVDDSSIERQVYHTFIIRAKDRDALKKYLAKNGIQTNIHYPRPYHKLTAMMDDSIKYTKLPCAEKLSTEILSLPVHPFLTEEHIIYVSRKINDFYE